MKFEYKFDLQEISLEFEFSFNDRGNEYLKRDLGKENAHNREGAQILKNHFSMA